MLTPARMLSGGRCDYGCAMPAPLRVLLALLIAAALAPAAAAEAKTVWLCKPGLSGDPCSPGLDTTRFSPVGEQLGIERVKRARPRRIDCFYAYPTVSDQKTFESDRAIDPELRSIALYQAARFSRDCRVYAPVYRQITLAGLFGNAVAVAGPAHAYRDVRAAWREYLRHYNRGRGFVLIGHSQGTFNLTRLIAEEIDQRPAVRRRLVSALLLGGNVTVDAGKDAGGDFDRVRACRAARQLGCVVAFSTFGQPVPENAPFGRTNRPGEEVLCTNPAALAGGEGVLDLVLPRAPFAPGTTIAAAVDDMGFARPPASTPWLAFPDGYSARCSSDGGADVLRVTALDGAPALNPVPPTWGLHIADANIALGNLARLVRRQAAEYARRR
jgi:hypothetical protein